MDRRCVYAQHQRFYETKSPAQAHAIHYTMPEDSQGFITEWKGKPIDGTCLGYNVKCDRNVEHSSLRIGVVEQVKDGSTLRIRLILPDGDHQFVNITLAGVRSPRVANKPEETSEPFGEEVKFCFAIPLAFPVLTHGVGQILHGDAPAATSSDRTPSFTPERHRHPLPICRRFCSCAC